MRTRRSAASNRLPSVSSIADFRPGIDVVVHDPAKGGHCFVRDTQGCYADVQVESDIMDASALSGLKATPPHQIAMKMQATRLTPILSREGREQRMTALREAWQRHFGDALFAVIG